MKALRKSILLPLALILAAPASPAQTYNWALSTNGSWDTTSDNWSGAGTKWVNGSGSDAVFAGSSVLVSLSQGITANVVRFNSAAYTLSTSNGSGLTLAGSGAGIETNFSAAASVSISVPLAGTAGFTKTGTGRVVMNSVSTYTGSTVVSQGVLQVATGNDRLPITTDLSVSSGASLVISSGRSQQLNSLSGSGTVTGSGASLATLTLGGNNASFSFAGNMQNGGAGGLAVVKTGSGTMTLTGNKAYTGGTTVSAGTLRNNGTLASAVSVESGATLGGTGTFNGLVTTQAGAHLSPGNSLGTVTFSAGLNLAEGAMLDFELGDPAGTPGLDSDLIVVTAGTLTGSTGAGGVVINLSNTGAFGGGVYSLISYAGATPADFDLNDFAVGSAPSGYSYSFSFGTNAVQLTATAIPEVSPILLAALAGFGMLRRRRQLCFNTV